MRKTHRLTPKELDIIVEERRAVRRACTITQRAFLVATDSYLPVFIKRESRDRARGGASSAAWNARH